MLKFKKGSQAIGNLNYLYPVMVWLSLISLSIQAKPIFTVAGSLKDSQGQLITEQLAVEVTNQTRETKSQTQLGLQEPGKFALTWSNFDGQSVVELEV